MQTEILNLIIYESINKPEPGRDTLYKLIYDHRKKPDQLFSLLTFGIFILFFVFYYNINLLLALFVLLLFLWWFLRSDFNFFVTRYKNSRFQQVESFNTAQNLILKGNFQKAAEVLALYRNIYNDQQALALYNYILFVNGNVNEFEKNLAYLKEYEFNDYYKLLIGISDVILKKNEEALDILETDLKVGQPLDLIRYLYLAYAFRNLGNGEKMQEYCEKIINSMTRHIVIENNAKNLLKEQEG